MSLERFTFLYITLGKAGLAPRSRATCGRLTYSRGTCFP